MASNGTCSVDGCEKRAEKRGWCSGHYSRWKRHGDPLRGGPINANRSAAVKSRPRKPIAVCTVDGCEKRAEKRGWCGMHYRRWQRTGSVHTVRSTPGVGRVEKHCPDCETTKPIAEFYRFESRKVWSAKCRTCTNARNEQRRQLDRDRDLAVKREWYARNREEVVRRGRERYWSDPEAARAAKRADHAKHARQRYERHRERLATDPAYRAKFRRVMYANTLKRRAAKRGALIAAVSADQIEAKVAYWGDRCWCCGGEWSEIDHVKPVSKGGSHMLANLRPICSPCNKAKSARWPIDTSTRALRLAA